MGGYGAGNGMNSDLVGSNGNGLGPVTGNSGTYGGGGGGGGGNALSTAAMVAAAATATATATASVVALQDNNQFTNQQYSQGYQQTTRMMPTMNGMNPMSHQMTNAGPMVGMGGGGGGAMQTTAMGPMGPKMQTPGPTNNNMYHRSMSRMQPYPTAAMHQSQKRATSGTNQSYGQQTGPCPPMNPNMNPTMGGFSQNGQYPNYGQRQPNFNQYPTQQQLGPTGNFGPGSQMGPMTNTRQLRQSTPPYTNQSQYFQNQFVGTVPNQSGQYNMNQQQVTGQYNTNQQFQQDVQMRNNMNYQHSPIPGNPTPPLTPASSMPPYISPNPDVKPNFNDLKPPMPSQQTMPSQQSKCFSGKLLICLEFALI